MVYHTTTRRNAIIVLTGIWLLVCGGLGWATHSALQLEEMEARAARAAARAAAERSYDEARALSLERLDWLVESKIGHERGRRLEIFRSFFKPATAYDAESGAEVSVVLPSPLQAFPGPHLLLHFQASVIHGWSSPQLGHGAEAALPASAIPAVDRARQATAENWLAALRARYDPWKLLEVYEAAHETHIEKSKRFGAVDSQRDRAGEFGKSIVGASASRTAAEFARRGLRLLQAQREHLPEEACEPQTIALDNLQTGEDRAAAADLAEECVQVFGTPMLPVWLDLTMDGRPQLALLRSVSVERSEYCTMQGVLIDWDRLRRDLEEEVQDLLPGARVEPVPVGAPAEPNMLHAIPAKLASQRLSGAGIVVASAGPSLGLVVAWVATILALLAISYGTMNYVKMLERRMRFVAAVSHELRTPLTSFQLYTDLLSDLADGDRQRQRQYLDTLRRESKRLGRLVENVLVYAGIGDSKPALHPQRISPQALLDDVSAQCTEHCRKSGKRLVVENRCEDHLLVETDPEFVTQILSNLVQNACRYSADAADPRIWLSASPSAHGGATFEVEDAGRGVPPDDRKAVFEPFRRSHTNSEERAPGLGLGLALSRYWAECLGGMLQLKRGLRNGTHYSRFALSLPAMI